MGGWDFKCFLTKSKCCILTVSFLHQSLKVTSILLSNFLTFFWVFVIKFCIFLMHFQKKFFYIKIFYLYISHRISCLAEPNFYSHNEILLSRAENNLLIDHSKFLKIFCDLYIYCSGSCSKLFVILWYCKLIVVCCCSEGKKGSRFEMLKKRKWN